MGVGGLSRSAESRYRKIAESRIDINLCANLDLVLFYINSRD